MLTKHLYVVRFGTAQRHFILTSHDMSVCYNTYAAAQAYVAMQEGLELTCGNDTKGGPGPVQLSQQLQSHHPFGESPECHTNFA